MAPKSSFSRKSLDQMGSFDDFTGHSTSGVTIEKLKEFLGSYANNQIEQQLIMAMNGNLQDPFSSTVKETDEEIVLRLLKHDFEDCCGISFDKFIEIYHEILEQNPEKLI